MKAFGIILAVSIFGLSCSSPQIAETPSANRLPMLQLDDDTSSLPEQWKRWTPRARTDINTLFDPLYVFDYWWVKDAQETERVWSVFSSFLTFLDQIVEKPELHQTLRSTLAILEPHSSRKHQLDFTFFVSRSTRKSAATEGLAIRWGAELSNGAQPSMTVLLSKNVESTFENMDRIRIWIDPGFAELKPLTVFVAKTPQGWVRSISAGLLWSTSNGSDDGALLADIAHSQLWNPFTSSSYVEYQKKEPNDPKYLLKAFGKKILLREIEMVFMGTSFPPRFEFKPSKGD